MPTDIPKIRTPDYPIAERRRTLTKREKAQIILRQEGRCKGCGIKAKAWEFDHISARWKGQVSQTDLDNWQALASRDECDCHKNKTADEASDRAKMNRIRKQANLETRKPPVMKGASSFQKRVGPSPLSRKSKFYKKQSWGHK